MNPHVLIVLGIDLHYPDKITKRTVTKYDENTGKPYQKTITQTALDIPQWLQKTIEDIWENDDDWHQVGKISVFRDPTCGRDFFIGKLLAMFDPREMGDETIVIETLDTEDKAKVAQYLEAIGAPEDLTLLKNIKVRIGTHWL
jgi:hypothetical protein